MKFIVSTIPLILANVILAVFVENRDIQVLGLSINIMLYLIQIFLLSILEEIKNKK